MFLRLCSWIPCCVIHWENVYNVTYLYYLTHMKKVFFAIVAIVFAVSISSCSKDMVTENELNVVDASSAQTVFAKVLSKAVYENQALRFFIQSTALEQFDCDYDVFYPFVKDQEVENGQTFRDILLKYTDEKTLSSVEQMLPKLNILVPDWSWLGCFSVNSWDASSQDIAVMFSQKNGEVGVFSDGEYLGQLPAEGIPDFPVLVIKSNERMTFSPASRGADAQYGFVDEAFCNTETRVQHQYSDKVVDGTPDVSNFIPASQISSRVKEAYDYFPEGPTSIYQRDYIYYNMTANGQEKPRLDYVSEYIEKFRFVNFVPAAFFDDPDPKINSYNADFDSSVLYKKDDHKKNNDPRTAAYLRDFFKFEGKLDLQFLISIPSAGGGSFVTQKTRSVSFSDVFVLDHAHLDFRHKTWFVRDWYVYTIDASCISPKWYNLKLELPAWDISQNSSTITFSVLEIDEKGSNEYTLFSKKTIAHNFKFDTSGEVSWTSNDVKTTLKVGLGYNYTNTSEESFTEKITRSQGGVDELGKAELSYIKPVLLKRTSKNGVTGFEVYTISTGDVVMMVLPASY